MAYEKNIWQDGDLITEQKLNHMEDGIADAGASGIYIVDVDITTQSGVQTWTLNKTWQEIYDAIAAKYFVIIRSSIQYSDSPAVGWDIYTLYTMEEEDSDYHTLSVQSGTTEEGHKNFVCSYASDYPIYRFSYSPQ